MFTHKMIAVAALTLPAFAMAQTMPAPSFVQKAGAGDLYEKTSSELVLQTTKDAKVRSFANMMVKDHIKSTNDVKAAAQTDGVTVPALKLDADQTKMVADLRKATGPARDKLYVQQQKTAHRQALALHSGYAQSGNKARLKQTAAAIAPVVQHHIEMLGQM